MARRVNSELLLVGSLPADSAESALRSGAGFFDGLVFALPDGETGPRAGWVSYEREKLVRPNEGVVTLAETESPTGLPRHAYETLHPVLALIAELDQGEHAVFIFPIVSASLLTRAGAGPGSLGIGQLELARLGGVSARHFQRVALLDAKLPFVVKAHGDRGLLAHERTRWKVRREDGG